MTRTRSPEPAAGQPPVTLPDGAHALPGGLGWEVTGRPLAVRLLSDERLGVVESGPVMSAIAATVPADLRPAVDAVAEFAARIMLQAAPQRHRLLRKGFAQFFTASAVADLVPGMRSDAEEVARSFVAAGGGDFMGPVAFGYAARCAARLLGVGPPEFARLHQLSKKLALIAYALRTPDSAGVVRDGHSALELLRRLVAAGRAAAPTGSVLGAWRAGRIDLPDADIEANVVMLVQASLETVAGMLGNAAALILRDPATLADAAERERLIDESLRDTPPLKTLERMVREPVHVAGHDLPIGHIVSVRVQDANGTGATEPAVAGHAVLSFGWGAYRCLGARLARHQAIELFAAVARLAPDAVTPTGEPEMVRHIRFQMPRALPVRLADRDGLTDALVDALEEHDVDRPLTSLEREVAVAVLGDLGVTPPPADERPITIRRWVEWARANRG